MSAGKCTTTAREPQAERSLWRFSAKALARVTSVTGRRLKPVMVHAPTRGRRPASIDAIGVRSALVSARKTYVRLRRIRRAELPVDTVKLARYLIGKIVVHDTDSGRLSGRIVETEAYPVGDAAGHAFRGSTQRNRSLFLKRGHAYVCLNYGISFLLNVTSEMPGVGAGVLLRAIEPLEGIDAIRTSSCGTIRIADLGRGPGRLTKALRVDLGQDGLDLCAAGPLWLAATTPKVGRIGKSVRIGITRDMHRLLRFYEIGNAHVSGTKKLRQ